MAEYDQAYQALLQELQAPQQQAPAGPVYSPDEVRRRIAQNNQLIQLGLIGQMSGDQAAAGVGGQIFRQALADRDERQTSRGVQDPLTGETRIDPEYAAEQQRQRRGQIFQQALGYESKRQSDAAAERRAQEAHQARMAEIASRGEIARSVAGMRQPTSALPKPPPGYRYTADGQSMEAIPGGPAAVKADAAADKKNLALEGQLSMIDRVLENVARADAQVSNTTTGPLSKALAKVPGTSAYDLKATVKTIQANLGFNELAAMRQASPTGGALGNVSDRELKSLEATLANLDTEQSPAKVRQSLADVQRHYTNWKRTVEQARAEASARRPGAGVPAPAPEASPAPAPARPGVVRMRYDPATGKLIQVQ